MHISIFWAAKCVLRTEGKKCNATDIEEFLQESFRCGTELVLAHLWCTKITENIFQGNFNMIEKPIYHVCT